MPKVFNKHHKNAPKNAVYIGRGSIWGNPYTHLDSKHPDTIKVSSREEAVKAFEAMVREDANIIQYIRTHLKGKDLVCFCAPKACHGDILLQIANEEVTA